MDLKEFSYTNVDPADHWYYQSKAAAMIHFLEDDSSRVVLDVGSGSAFFSRYLLQKNAIQEAWCIDTGYAEEFDEEVADKYMRFRHEIGRVCADLVLLMDVLEHVDDDVALLKEYREKVPPGTRFLITVPAFQFLWSGHDDFLDHRRRYSLNQLEKIVNDSGLVLIKSCYYFGVIFPLVAPIRILQRLGIGGRDYNTQLKRHNPLVNKLLNWACVLDRYLMQHNRMFGLSVFCLAVNAGHNSLHDIRSRTK